MRAKLSIQFLIVLGLFLKTGINGLLPLKRPLITGISDVAFFSKDIKGNINFYENYLGLPNILSSKSKYSGEEQKEFELNRKQSIRLIAEKTPVGNRLAYFSIETVKAEALRQYLASKGIRVPSRISSYGDDGKGFFITDPNGTVCRIIENTLKDELNSRYLGQAEPNKIATKIGHVGFMVSDLNSAIRFYVGLLGFKETWRGSKDGKNLSWVNLQVPNGKEYIELMLYSQPQSRENMGVLNHVSLEVDDISKAAKILTDRQLPLNCKRTSSIKTGINKKRQINTFDIDSTRIEIMETNTTDGIPAKSFNVKPPKFQGGVPNILKIKSDK